MKMRAKYAVVSVTKTSPQYGEPGLYPETIKLEAVTNGSPEDNTFHKYTPWGSMDISITNPDLLDTIKPGDKYYIDFTLATE